MKTLQSLVLPLLFVTVAALFYAYYCVTYVTPAPAGYDEMIRNNQHGPSVLEVVRQLEPDRDLNESVDLNAEE